MSDPTPAGDRLSVTEPPIADDEELWLPPSAQGLAGNLEVAIVVELGADCGLPVQPGDRVYFHEGHFAKLGDVKIVPSESILAFETRTRRTP